VSLCLHPHSCVVVARTLTAHLRYCVHAEMCFCSTAVQVSGATLVSVTRYYVAGAKSDKVFYYENIEGGHGGAADNKQQAFMNTMYLNFLKDVLHAK
jgi:hypothetical protein